MVETPPPMERALALWRDVVRPVAAAQRIEVLAEPALRAPPLVLLLGNHSAGKSSLINHLMHRDVQRTGVAPTDDGFTVLFHGEGQALDGDALTARPDLPFGPLRRFGPSFLRHLKGRPVDAPLLKDVWLIDSPGMIDGGDTQRPYDFEAVVRALAEQADRVLLLFDPEKPGTTGETLTVLARSLGGMEDRLRVVMHKMDIFKDLRDFARAYGALCWNLSRTLKRQDVPHIYTTALPGTGGLAPESFQEALSELITDVASLPARRQDSLLNRMRAEARGIWLRAVVTEAARREARAPLGRGVLVLLSTLALCAAGWGINRLAAQPEQIRFVNLIWGTLALLGGGGVIRWTTGALRAARAEAPRRLEGLFKQVFRERLLSEDSELSSAWAGVGPGLKRHLATVGIQGFPPVSARSLSALAEAVEVQLPALHEGAAPSAPPPAPEGA